MGSRRSHAIRLLRLRRAVEMVAEPPDVDLSRCAAGVVVEVDSWRGRSAELNSDVAVHEDSPRWVDLGSDRQHPELAEARVVPRRLRLVPRDPARWQDGLATAFAVRLEVALD